MEFYNAIRSFIFMAIYEKCRLQKVCLSLYRLATIEYFS